VAQQRKTETKAAMEVRRSTIDSTRGRTSRTGFSLVELVVVLTIIAVMATISVPHFQRTIGRSRTDIAGANLRAIWSAQRLFWLENQTYASNLTQLQKLGLLDPVLKTAEPPNPPPTGQYWDLYFWYSLTAAGADPSNPNNPPFTTFTASVKASLYTGWTSNLAIDNTGTFSGSVTPAGSSETITPIDLW
jgi:prepilin-type N-terminal cleavage/methylation domain-containing protein